MGGSMLLPCSCVVVAGTFFGLIWHWHSVRVQDLWHPEATSATVLSSLREKVLFWKPQFPGLKIWKNCAAWELTKILFSYFAFFICLSSLIFAKAIIYWHLMLLLLFESQSSVSFCLSLNHLLFLISFRFLRNYSSFPTSVSMVLFVPLLFFTALQLECISLACPRVICIC